MIASIADYPTHSHVCQPLSWAILSGDDEECRSAQVQARWRSLLRDAHNPNAIYQSPDYFEHARLTEKRELYLVLKRDAAGEVQGLAPLRVWREYACGFRFRGRSLAMCHLPVAHILGGQPLGAGDPASWDDLLTAIVGGLPDVQAIRLPEVEVNSPLGQYLHTSRLLRQQFSIHLEDGIQRSHTLPLPATFDAYLGNFSSKKRYNLRREVRLLQEHGKGALELQRIEHPSHLPGFFQACNTLVGRTSKPLDGLLGSAGSEEYLHAAGLASRGLLRCYTLQAGGQYVGIIHGYQYGDAYTILGIIHDEQLRRLSPGTVMVYLAIQDVIEAGGIKTIHFGCGDLCERHQSANIIFDTATVFLFRKTLANRMLCGSLAGFAALVRAGKRCQQGARRVLGQLGFGPGQR